MGDQESMFALKHVLGGMVTYLGIKSYYDYFDSIKLNRNGNTKVNNYLTQVCILEDKINKNKYICKCFKKSAIRLSEIH